MATCGVMQVFDGVPAQAYYGAPDTVPLWGNFREWWYDNSSWGFDAKMRSAAILMFTR